MAKKNFKAKVIMDDENNIQITPYNHNETATRYPIIKKTLHGALSETGSTYRLLISVSKSKGPQKAAEIMLDEATTASEYLYEIANTNDD